ncbi:methyltransferase [Nocardia cyriacigeorgica]|uniref:O-methyltransferase n=1 Tax=Nocardia cyriacigeorgica TaxID=135487 RepID=UPI0013B7954E|nr:class I SAM-dependent methyltransferase [Nocardia cyriacigeorgica]NEW50546.1 methyltransferase [Nocardia cyriacigeorgica]
MNAGTLQDPELDRFVAELQQRSLDQIPAIGSYFADRVARDDAADPNDLDADANDFLADKLIALEHDKAMLCHRVCLAMRARQVVEVGTSYGVSTLYLAQAVHLVTSADGGTGRVIGTEIEPAKAATARQNFHRAGLDELIDLREGDVRTTLVDLDVPIDLALIDIWPVLARPALELIVPKLRPGGVVFIDNTDGHRENYRDALAFIDDPANRLLSQTLPFSSGLEMVVKQ